MRALTRRSLLASGAAAMMIPGAALAQATTLKMAGVPEDSATTVLYGIQSGLFRSHGLNVDLQTQVNCVVPGLIETVRAGKPPTHRAGKTTLVGRNGTPGDVAGTVRWLAGPAARYVTGQTIHVNGGVYLS
jgi:hypothetical protein